MFFFIIYATEVVFNGVFNLPIRTPNEEGILVADRYESVSPKIKFIIPEETAIKIKDLNDPNSFTSSGVGERIKYQYRDSNNKIKHDHDYYIEVIHPISKEKFWMSVSYLMKTNAVKVINDSDCIDCVADSPMSPQRAVDQVTETGEAITEAEAEDPKIKLSSKVTKGCEFLVTTKYEEHSKLPAVTIKNCIKAIATKLAAGEKMRYDKKSYLNKLKKLYNLTKEEQNFFSLIWTGLGEVSSNLKQSKSQDFMIIFKVIENRFQLSYNANEQNNKTYADIILARSQISMFNNSRGIQNGISGANRWLNIMIDNKDSKIDRVIAAYQEYSKGIEISGGSRKGTNYSKITHYLNPVVTRRNSETGRLPGWTNSMRAHSKLKINGKPVHPVHTFYEGPYNHAGYYTVRPHSGRKVESGVII